MTQNIRITKKDGKNSVTLLRKFTQKVRNSGLVPKVKALRYHARKASPFKTKSEALRKIEKTKIIERERKLGKRK